MCKHPRYVVIKYPPTLKQPEPTYALKCYVCHLNMPFYFWSEAEWLEEIASRKVVQ
jgi:hypothetical protein